MGGGGRDRRWSCAPCPRFGATGVDDCQLLVYEAGVEVRGAGAELRLYGSDPDAAEARARAAEAPVLDKAADKPHGLREAYLVDPDGYVWVPCLPAAPK